MFNATFNNISVISCRSVLLMGKTEENHQPITSHLSHNVVSSTHYHKRDSNSQLFVALCLCQILKHCIYSIFLHKCICCIKFYLAIKYNIKIKNNSSNCLIFIIIWHCKLRPMNCSFLSLESLYDQVHFLMITTRNTPSWNISSSTFRAVRCLYGICLFYIV